MAIDFTLPPEIEEIRQRVRTFIDDEVRPRGDKLDFEDESTRAELITAIIELRLRAKELELFLPQMPKEWGGLGLGATAMAFVQAEASRSPIGSFVLNCQAPDEGNMHTLLHFGSDHQKEKYLKPLCEGWMRSCFSMTEPEVAGSDPTGIQTRAEEAEGGWVINGHKWFTSGARGANFAIVIACTDPDAPTPQARNTAFIVDLPHDGVEIVRDIETMAGRGAHSEILYKDVFVPGENLFGGRGQGHRLGQVRLGPARLAHCMRWIGQAELALEMMIDRAQRRQLHGAPLASKQGIQWMIADSAMELYTGKLMVLHAAYKIENDLDFRQEVSFAKHHVANMLWRIIDRAIQVHGALGYSADTPLQQMMRHARSARLVDGADEVHQWRIADLTMKAFSDTGSVRAATGDLGF